MTATMPDVACPKCGGPTYDNRTTKKNPAQPDFKCRNYKNGCPGVIWPPRNGPAPVAPAAPVARPAAPASAYVGNLPGDPGPVAADFAALCVKYRECVAYVVASVLPVLEAASPSEASAEAIGAMSATLFIARNQKGV